MPITQDRMLRLIHAADDTLQKLRLLRGATKHAAELTAEGKPADEVLHWLETFAAGTAPDPDHTETIASERMHFKHAQHRNNRMAAKMRQQRGTGTPEDAPLTTPIRPRRQREFQERPHYAKAVRASEKARGKSQPWDRDREWSIDADPKAPDLDANPEAALDILSELAHGGGENAPADTNVDAPTAQQLADDAAFAQELFRDAPPKAPATPKAKP